jgi:hypothetical protein
MLSPTPSGRCTLHCYPAASIGVVQSLQMEGRTTDAQQLPTRFKMGWSRADVALTASRLGRRRQVK